MTNFITDNTSLPATKTDLTAIPGGADPTKYVTAADWMAHQQALLDIQTWARSLVVDPGLFGDGSDGALHFDGAATVLGIAPSSSKYTLTRDIYATTITIDVGVTVIPNRFRIFATGTLTLNGKISGDGAAGADGAGGGAAGAEDASVGSLPRNAAGGAGATGNGGVGTDGQNVPRGYSGAGGTNSGGSNANGSAGGTGAGGAAGDTTAAVGGAGGLAGTVQDTTTRGDAGIALLSVLGAVFSVQNGFTAFSGRTGGGGGGGCGDSFGGSTGGGGGASGHYLVVCAPTFAGSGSITSKGGKGGNGTPAKASTGGGGGGGGYIVLVLNKSSPVPTTDVSGGAGGTIGASGGTSGAGGAGVVRTFKVGT